MNIAFKDAQLVFDVFGDALDFHRLDFFRARVFFHTITGVNAHVHHGTVHTGRHAQRAVFDVRGFLAKNRTQEFFFRRLRTLALRRNFTNENVARFHFRTDMNDTGAIQFRQRTFLDVWNVAADFLRTEFGIARDAGQLLDVNGGKAVFLDNTLGNEDGVLEVIAVPRHEGDEHILPQRQFAQIGGRAVGKYITTRDHIARLDQRLLVDTSVLVGAGVFGEVVNIYPQTARLHFIIIDLDDNTRGINEINHPATLGAHQYAGIAGNDPFHTGTDQRLVGAQRRHRLTLHVRAHQRTVSVIMLQEWNKRSGDGDDLLRRNVHIINTVSTRQHEFIFVAGRDKIVAESAVFIKRGIRLGDNVFGFLNCRKIFRFHRHLAIHDFPIRRFKETVFIGFGINGKRVDQADVRTFRRFNGAETTVVRRVHVAHFKTRAFARQSTRAERGNTALVSDFRQRVVLIHKLRQLRRAEEFFDRGGNRFLVNQIFRRQLFGFNLAQALFNRALEAHQTNAESIGCHFTDATDAAITEVVNIINRTVTIFNGNQCFQDADNIFPGEHTATFFFLNPQAAIEFHPPDAGKIIAFFIEKEIFKKTIRRIFRRRFTRTHHAVNFRPRIILISAFISTQSISNISATVQLIDIKRFKRFYAQFNKLHDMLFSENRIGL